MQQSGEGEAKEGREEVEVWKGTGDEDPRKVGMDTDGDFST